MLTVQETHDFARARLGGRPSLPMVTVCNRAGRHLVAMHEWRWLIRPAVELTLVAGQDWAALPADFGRAVSVYAVGGVRNLFEWATAEEIDHWRQTSFPTIGTWQYRGSIGYARDLTGAVRPQLELYPTPTADSTSSLKLRYRAGWTPVAKDSDILSLPEGAIENLYLEIVCAMVQGFDESDTAPPSARLDGLSGSEFFRVAILEDAMRQAQLGQMVGGAMQGVEADQDWSLYPASIGAPGSEPS